MSSNLNNLSNLSNYANPVYPNAPAPVIAPMTTSYIPKGCAAPVVQHHHHKPSCGFGRYNEAASILVLFILLVIITRAWII